MSGEPIDITTHTHSNFEERIQKLEKGIRRLERFHESQEELYGVTAQRTMLDEVISTLCLKVDSIEDNPNYRPYTRVSNKVRNIE